MAANIHTLRATSKVITTSLYGIVKVGWELAVASGGWKLGGGVGGRGRRLRATSKVITTSLYGIVKVGWELVVGN